MRKGCKERVKFECKHFVREQASRTNASKHKDTMSSQPPQVYNFPYEPYPEQRKLMDTIYECIESSSVGCFESPTGTGKSLSAICASFDWLIKEEKRVLALHTVDTATGGTAGVVVDDGDWLSELYTPSSSENNSDKAKTIKKYDAVLKSIAQSNESKPRSSFMLSREHTQSNAKKNTIQSAATDSIGNTLTDEDAEFALKHYDSEDELKTHRDDMYGSDSDRSDSDESVTATRSAKRTPKMSTMDKLQLPQIFYCSRTHSQLAQFIAEMNKTIYTKVDPITKLAPIRCVTLGSRRNLCVNENIVKLKSESHMSEACLEMQKKGSKKSAVETGSKRSKLHNHTKCPYHHHTKEKGLSMKTLATVQDIEDIRNLGASTDACAYYATRNSITNANVVCLPYNLLLNKDMRESLGLNLAGKVIIIDEAHNLIETINSLYSAELTVSQIDTSIAAIGVYLRRFSTLLSPKNLYYVNILSSVLAKVKKVLCPKIVSNKNSNVKGSVDNTTITTTSDYATSMGSVSANTTTNNNNSIHTTITSTLSPTISPTVGTTSATMTVNDFLFNAKLDNINLFKLRKHILDTNLVNKIGAYAEAVAQREAVLNVQIHNHNSTNTNTNANTNTNTNNTKNGAVGSVSTAAATGNKSNSVIAALRCALELVTCLTNLQGDGRIFILNMPDTTTSTNTNPTSSDAVSITTPTVRYVMLNPSVHFLPLITQARSVVLLGGTMQPFSYFTSLLLPTVDRSRLRLFSCEHVVPATQVGAIIVPYSYASNQMTSNNGASQSKKVTFEFTYATRASIDLTNALFSALVEICENTPGGVVVFCTSFSYLDTLLTRWRNSKMLYKLDAVKRVFAESRSGTNYTASYTSDTTSNSATTNYSDHVWESYKTHVTNNPVEGAILFSVINGKLSEGINFSDYLARCVVVVGMPYPDTRDVVLQEKMKYVSVNDTQEKTSTVAGGGAHSSSLAVNNVSSKHVTNSNIHIDTTSDITHYNTPAGRKLCENMCMRSVNQSVGRAIRHINDYACVVLLDRRYTQDHLRAQLPKWLVRNLQVCSSGSSSSSGGSNSVGYSIINSCSSGNVGMNGASEPKLGDALKVFFQNQKVD